MSNFEVISLLAGSDNYIHIFQDYNSKKVAVVDPTESSVVVREIEKRSWSLDYILITHPHFDHVGGVEDLKSRFQSKVIGFLGDKDNIPGFDRSVVDKDQFCVGDINVVVLTTPGHTSGHVAYWLPDEKALFSGDTLFSLGCGRVFEGTPSMMWDSLFKLRKLPDDTRLYCAHEYTLSNAKFALSIDPDNQLLIDMSNRAEKLRKEGRSTIPSLLGDEKACNPFLRADDSSLQQTVNLASNDPVDIFAFLRKSKDNF